MFLTADGEFQDKAHECAIDKLDFSIGVKHKKPRDLSHPIDKLREQISRRPTWESYSKGFFIHFATSGSRVCRSLLYF